MTDIIELELPAHEIRHGDYLAHYDLYVVEIGSNSSGKCVFWCSYTPDGYPGTSILLDEDELVTIHVLD
jgi:hypothetical protein